MCVCVGGGEVGLCWQSTSLFVCVCGGGGAQSSGQLAFMEMYNFLQVMVLLKNAVCSNGFC